jgi:inorganic pyrophosphatase
VESIDVVVETPRGSRNKYEMDEKSGVIRLDRRLPGSFAFPADYGYEPAYQDIHDLAEVAQHERDELGNFFDIYRGLDEHSDAVSEGPENADAAATVLAEARERRVTAVNSS